MPIALQAQQRIISGIVKDTAGNTLGGASITEKGMVNNAASTGDNGKFKITLKGASNTLIITYLNFKKQEINVLYLLQKSVQFQLLIYKMR